MASLARATLKIHLVRDAHSSQTLHVNDRGTSPPLFFYGIALVTCQVSGANRVCKIKL